MANRKNIRAPKASRFSQRGVFQLPSFGSIFSSPAPAPAPPANPGPTGNQTPPGSPLPGVTPGNPTAPLDPNANPGNNGNPPAPPATVKLDPANPQSYLDAQKDIWQTPNPSETADKPIFDGLDPKKVMESAGKVNFSQVITPEQTAAIAAGGEGAVKAFTESLNRVAQTVYGQNAIATTQIVEQALAKQAEQIKAALPSIVRKMTTNNSLAEQNPLFSHPAVAPFVQTLQGQLLAKNPNATTQEINTQVTEFIQALGSTAPITPPANSLAAQAAKKSEDIDWEKYLST